MAKQKISIKVSGNPGSGKSSIAAIIYNALRSKGIDNVKIEDDFNNRDIEKFLINEEKLIQAMTSREIIIETAQTQRGLK